MDTANLSRLLEEIVLRYRPHLQDEQSTSLSRILRAFFASDLCGMEQVVQQYRQAPEDGVDVLGIFASLVGRLTNDRGSQYTCMLGELCLCLSREGSPRHDRFAGGDAGGRYVLRLFINGNPSTSWYQDYGDRARSSQNLRSHDPGRTKTLNTMVDKAQETLQTTPNLDALCPPYDSAASQQMKAAVRAYRASEQPSAPVTEKSWVRRLMFWT